MSTTFYKRPLPTDLVPFASADERRIFREALDAGTMAGYFALAEQFHTQADPAFCGLGTLVVVLNALAIDPGPERLWKGPWRWFSEEHLDCCRPLAEIQRSGLTLSQLACLARCNGARAEIKWAQDLSIDTLRDLLREAATTTGEPHLVVSYDRATLGQTGAGHFSPVGGYHEALDLVLILDVARFKYPPHWVPLQSLYRAMLPHDPDTGKSRGLVRLWRRATGVSLYSIHATDTSWRSLVCEQVFTESRVSGSLGELLQRLLRGLPRPALALIQRRTLDAAVPDELGSVHAALLAEIEEIELMKLVRSALPDREVDAAAVVLLLLTIPPRLLRCLTPALRDQLESLRDLSHLPPTLRKEVDQLRLQAEALDESGSCAINCNDRRDAPTS